jgi:hypothetical protein
MSNLELFADLFAFRFMLLETFGFEEDSDFIIKKLKYKLIEMGINHTEINEFLHEFYNHYEINVSLEQIRNSEIRLYIINDILLTNFINNFINNQNDDNDNANDNANDNDNANENETTRLTEEEVNRIPLLTIEEELDDTCSICLDRIEIESLVYRIPCNHKFHKNCLKPHLINYNRYCPLCRNECFSNNN